MESIYKKPSLDFNQWRFVLKAGAKTGYQCGCGRFIWNYKPIGGMFCYRCPITSLDFKSMVNYHMENNITESKITPFPPKN